MKFRGSRLVKFIRRILSPFKFVRFLWKNRLANIIKKIIKKIWEWIKNEFFKLTLIKALLYFIHLITTNDFVLFIKEIWEMYLKEKLKKKKKRWWRWFKLEIIVKIVIIFWVLTRPFVLSLKFIIELFWLFFYWVLWLGLVKTYVNLLVKLVIFMYANKMFLFKLALACCLFNILVI